jgi:hypothetical protein
MEDTTRFIGEKVTSVFSQNLVIQVAMGYNKSNSNSKKINVFPQVTALPLAKNNRLAIPEALSSMFPDMAIKQVSQIQISQHNRVDKGTFVTVSTKSTIHLTMHCLLASHCFGHSVFIIGSYAFKFIGSWYD